MSYGYLIKSCGEKHDFASGQVVFEVPMEHQTEKGGLELRRGKGNVITILSDADTGGS